MSSIGRTAFVMSQGHGHYAQFLNFQECFPPDQRQRAIWIALQGEHSGSIINRLPFVPGGLRFRFNQAWHMNQGLAQSPQLNAVFLAGAQISLLRVLRRYRCYAYTDFTPSIKRELAPWYDHQLGTNPALRALKERIERALHRMCQGVFTMSRWAGNGVIRDYGLPQDRVFISLPGANLNRWHFVERQGRKADQPVRILMVGGEFRRKGGPLLLEWAERTRLRNWELDIVTWPGELPDWVQASMGYPKGADRKSAGLAPRLPNVRIHCGMKANTPELMNLYREADVFCLPTQADGSSIASLEAMATGLPTLVSGVGGIPELIEHTQTGFLLRRGDLGDLTTRLEQLIGDPELRLQIGASARAACESYFNVTRQMQEVLAILDRDQAR